MIWKKGRRLEWRSSERRFGNGAAQKLLEVLFVGREREKRELRRVGCNVQLELKSRVM